MASRRRHPLGRPPAAPHALGTRADREQPPPRPGPPRPGRRPPRARPRPRGRGHGRRDPRPGRPHRGGAARCGLARVVGIDRDPARARPGRRAAGAVRRPLHRRARRLRRAPRVLDDLGLDAVDGRAVRPRCLLDAARRHRARLRLPRGRAARHADGPHQRPHRRRRPQRLPGRRADPGAREYGEEKFARRIAARSSERARAPFTTSARLVELLYAAIPAPARRTGGHPAKRTFQALRMEVNDELAVLRRALPAAIDAIRVGGRLVVQSYHSLEDRLVKQAFTPPPAATCRSDLPFVPEGHEPALRLLIRGAEKAVAAGDRGEPPSRFGPAARRRTSQRSRFMNAPRNRDLRPLGSPGPRLREDAPMSSPVVLPLPDRPAPRGRRSSARGCGWYPRRRGPRLSLEEKSSTCSPHVDADAGRRRRTAATSTPPMQQAAFATTALEEQAQTPSPPAQQTLEDGARRAPQPPAGRRSRLSACWHGACRSSACTVRLAAQTTEHGLHPGHTPTNTPRLLAAPAEEAGGARPRPVRRRRSRRRRQRNRRPPRSPRWPWWAAGPETTRHAADPIRLSGPSKMVPLVTPATLHPTGTTPT